MNDRYYRSPTPLLGQGDILADVLSLRVLNPTVEFIRRRTTSRGPVADIYTPGGSPAPQQAFDRRDDTVLARAQVSYGMVLSNACDWDNSARAPVLIGFIRPLEDLPEDARANIRTGANGRFLHLPENDVPVFEESFLDFSRATTYRLDGVQALSRVLSPTAELLTALYVGMTHAFTRLEPVPDLLTKSVAKAIDEAMGP